MISGSGALSKAGTGNGPLSKSGLDPHPKVKGYAIKHNSFRANICDKIRQLYQVDVYAS